MSAFNLQHGLSKKKFVEDMVSVCIAAYNHEAYIAEAIDSVLSQTYSNFEIIVVDDCSTDGTAQVIAHMEKLYPSKIRAIFNETNKGIGVTGNIGFAAANGEYVALLGSDDRMRPERLREQVRFLKTHPRCAAVFSNISVINENGAPHAQAAAFEIQFNKDFEDIRHRLLSSNFINAPSCMIRTRNLLAADGYSPFLKYTQDYELWGKLLRFYDIGKHSGVLTEYRVHGANLSIGVDPEKAFTLNMEIVQVIAGFVREWPLELLIKNLTDSSEIKAKALLELAGLLELVDRHYLKRPAIGCALAYDLLHQAEGLDPGVSFKYRLRLEAAFQNGFNELRQPFADVRPLWLKLPVSAFVPAAPEADIYDWLKRRVLTKAEENFIQNRETASETAILVVILDPEGSGELINESLSIGPPQGLSFNFVVFTDATGLPQADNTSYLPLRDWPAQLNQVTKESTASWIIILSAGDIFLSSGLHILNEHLSESSAQFCRAIFCDELYRQENGELGAAFRPSFNLDYLISFPAGMSKHWLFRRTAILEAGGFDGSLETALELDLILRLINEEGLAGLAHIAEPLLITKPPVLANVEDERLAILQHLRRRDYSEAKLLARLPGRYHVDYGHAGRPKVSILVEAGDNLSKLQRCIESLLEITSYSAFEVTIVETAPEALDVGGWLAAIDQLGEAKLKVLRLRSAEEALAVVLNRASNKAAGDYLLFLSADIAVIEEMWLNEMLNHAQRGEVGAVGGKLLSKDGKIAQSIKILGLNGPVGSPFVGEPLDAPGYMQRLQVDQDCSAISRDCMMIPRDLFLELGGFKQDDTPNIYLELDLALRIGATGYLVVWSPEVRVMLDRSENAVASAAEQDAIYANWLPQLARDPAYNANFSLAQPGGFKLADVQLSWRPLSVLRPSPVVLAHPADLTGCGHYRVIQPFNALKECGLIDGALSRGLMHVADLERYDPDVVVLQRQIGEDRLEAMRRMRAFSRAFKVYELDDYLPNLPVKSIHREHMPKDIVKSLRRGLSSVDRFVVSTEALGEALASMHPDIRVMKNKLDPGWWGDLPTSLRLTSAKPRVGWAGGASHTGDLEMIFDVVKALADEVDWVFFGMCPAKLRPYIHEFHAGVPIEEYPVKLAGLNLDLALAPVEQNLFNECKSNLRLLEYGICGYPVICTDIRCYEGDLPVTRVRNRYKDWMDAIRMHLADLDTTQEMGDRLKSRVQRDWMLAGGNLELWCKAWLPD